MQSEVAWVSGNQFRLTLTDVTTTKTFTTLQTMAARNGVPLRCSAEWIVEAPSSGSGGILTFPTLSPSSFSACAVTVNGTTGPISGSGWLYDP